MPKVAKILIDKKTRSKTKLTSKPSNDVLKVADKAVINSDLPKGIFNAKVNHSLMAQAVRIYLINQRKGTSSTKTRAEVAGTNKKVYRQKGTGRARHGSQKAPIYVGGGIVFGPKPRQFSLHLSKKMQKLALFSALTDKLNRKQIIISEDLEKIEPKTKSINSSIKALLKNTIGIDKKNPKVLIVLPRKLKNITQSLKNLAYVNWDYVQNLNTYQVLNHEILIFLKSSLNDLEKFWLKEEKVKNELSSN